MTRKNAPEPPSFFTEALFGFLRDLAAHNDREWFQANKARYEKEVREPVQAFLLAAVEPMAQVHPEFSRGVTFRIFRDTRFSRDKTPYKTHVGIHFRHGACTRDVHSPGFYLHLEPGGCFAGSGIWHPPAPVLRTLREWIADHPSAWKALERKGIQVLGDTLKRVPQGFAADHPLADALRLKDHYTHAPLSEAEVCAPQFMEQYATLCRTNLPLMELLSKALGLPW